MPLQDPTLQVQTFTGDRPVDWLVDKDFRARFVNRRQREVSFSALVKSSSAAGETSIATERRRSVEGKGKGKMPQSTGDMVPQGPTNTEEAEDEEGHGEDGEPVDLLPRTKSQLSLMIERERRASEGNAKGKGNEKPRKTST
jgi:hypothetical protein